MSYFQSLRVDTFQECMHLKPTVAKIMVGQVELGHPVCGINFHFQITFGYHDIVVNF